MDNRRTSDPRKELVKFVRDMVTLIRVYVYASFSYVLFHR